MSPISHFTVLVIGEGYENLNAIYDGVGPMLDRIEDELFPDREV